MRYSRQCYCRPRGARLISINCIKLSLLFVVVVVVVMCLSPIKNYQWYSPAYKYGITEYECGKCPECLGKKSNAWALRAVMQAKESKHNCMITLTYDTFKRDEKGNILRDKNGIPLENLVDHDLSKRDAQLFIKRLRRYFEYHYGIKGIKIILSAERGRRTNRPHYHATLFGVKFNDLIYHKKSKRGNSIYRSPTLEKLWKNGICTVDSTTVNSGVAKYCVKYSLKNLGINDTFMLCSRGIGFNELLKRFNGLSYWIDGKEHPIPRQIWQKIITERYNLSRKKFTFVNPFNGECSKVSPTCKYLNLNKDNLATDNIALFLANTKARSLYRKYRDRDTQYQGYLDYWKSKINQRIQLPAIDRVNLLSDKMYHSYKNAFYKWSYAKAGIIKFADFTIYGYKGNEYRYIVEHNYPRSNDTKRKKSPFNLEKYLIDYVYQNQPAKPIGKRERSFALTSRLIRANDTKKDIQYRSLVFFDGECFTESTNCPVFTIKKKQISIFD